MIKDETMNISYDLDYVTNKFSKWTNSCDYIMLHHTAWWSFKSNMTLLSSGSRIASAHYVIWKNGEIWRIWLDDYVLWHTGAWSYPWMKTNFWNNYCIWIEVVSDWYSYTKKQIETLEKLVKELQKKHSIWIKNIIRHKDYAPKRKWDIGDNFFKIMWYKTFQEWKYNLTWKIGCEKLLSKIRVLEKEIILKDAILDIKTKEVIRLEKKISDIINIAKK